jgi:hypothetical protein
MTQDKIDPDLEAAAAGILALAEHGIPADIQELLVRGSLRQGIRPGALSAAFKATLLAYKRHEQC